MAGLFLTASALAHSGSKLYSLSGVAGCNNAHQHHGQNVHTCSKKLRSRQPNYIPYFDRYSETSFKTSSSYSELNFRYS